MSNIGKKPIYKPENLSFELQKFGNVSILLKMTSQQLYFLPSVAKTATKFYKLNRVLVEQAKNQN